MLKEPPLQHARQKRFLGDEVQGLFPPTPQFSPLLVLHVTISEGFGLSVLRATDGDE